MAAEMRALATLAELASQAEAPKANFSLYSRRRFCCQNGDCDHAAFIYNGIATSQSDCEAKCNAFGDRCQFYTYYTSAADCQLSDACEASAQAADTSGSTYRRNSQPSAWIPVAKNYTERFHDQQSFLLESLWNDNITMFATLSLPSPSQTLHGDDPGPGPGPNMASATDDAYPTAPPPGARCPPSWPRNETVTVRELLGYTPWYFGVLPNASAPTRFEDSWRVLTAEGGFNATWGLLTAERRAPCYNYSGRWALRCWGTYFAVCMGC
jgi:hypothetical protein